ncbi:3-oxoacyl-[acyl-carrier-protein] synthase 3 protein 2 [Paenibacillus montaniterrae]|uniref:Beta-ketoacyl-[acyl-carrier-protein] synthase III n=1 Tax=Paenibacillus montaniterrae TaxID=429341 RepID=A0A920CVA5_9BACL|nr:ketoacyl-ACP synthase III [Paenibacillus montaniterrae]GIP14796.1 3-oxoacyl-[acyl-carrier-protein] synthase 3 protein 2 [Paenibacillus montaniterrae]
MIQSRAKISAIGSYVPDTIMTNEQFTKIVDTSDEWIVSRTGIKERRYAAEHEYTSDLGCKAVQDLVERYGKSIDDVDLIICCTFSPDAATPSSAAIIQAKLGLEHAGAIDLNAACAGFTYGLHIANSLVTTGLHKKILVIGSETLSKLTDFTDRTTCILFGDGAGAVLVEYDEDNPSFHAYHMGTEGEKSKHLYCSGISSQLFNEPIADTRKIVQNGREVYRWAVTTVPEGVRTLLDKAGRSLEEIDWFVPHSANLRMIESMCERMSLSLDKTLYSLEYYGNTSSASIPLALDLAVRDGRVQKGDQLLLYGFGGGLTHAGLLITWQI